MQEIKPMATVTPQRMTLEQFRALPEGPPNVEFEEGEVIPVPSPTLRHQRIVLKLGSQLMEWAEQRKLGLVCISVDVYLPDGRCFVPDLQFLLTDHLNLIDPEDQKIYGVPDLAVEITSSDPDRDRVHKFHIYYDNGVPWYWIIDSDNLAIEEYRATPEGYVRKSSVASGEEFRPGLFPGLVINLATLLGPS
jgi:Uma2 family endonuclease